MEKNKRETQEKTVNEVIISGTIRRKVRKDDDWLLLMIVTSSPAGRKDTPMIYWYGKKIDMVDSAFNEGDHVVVNGTIATSKKYRTESILGIDINDTPREFDVKFDDESGGRYLPDENEVRLKGALVHLFDPKNPKEDILIATIKTITNGQIGFPEVVFFGKQRDKISKAKPGDIVRVLGHIQTAENKDPKTGRIRLTQSTICHYTYNE